MYASSAGRTGSCRTDEKWESHLRYTNRIPLLHITDKKYLLCVAKETAKEVFFMKKIKKQFTDSMKELKRIRTLVVIAMLIAVAVVIGFFSVQVTDFLKISFAFIANELTAFLFGPVAGGVMAGCADIIKYLVKPTGPFFFGFTFDAILGGVIYGMMLYKRPFTLKRIAAAKLLVMVIVNIGLNTYWLNVMYGSSFIAILPIRVVKECIMFPIETMLFYTTVKMLEKAKVISELRGGYLKAD